MTLDAAALLAHAHRPAAELTRRDVARLMLSVPSTEALAAMPALRRELLAARNPLSAKFWESAESILRRIALGNATVGEVHGWLEATGTEPTAIIGLHVWEEEPDRTPLGHEMHDLLVAHLETCLAAGDIDPDLLLAEDPAALEQYRALQERWLSSSLPDGRVPMEELLDEADEDLLAEWNAAEQAALDELHDILADIGERPRPDGELAAACRSLRSALRRGGWPVDLLRAGGGVDLGNLEPDDQRLWLQLAAGVIRPVDDPPDGIPLDELSATALEHDEWLWAVEALARGGPGTGASAEDLARFAAGAGDNGDDSNDVGVLADWFQPVVELWQLLGALDDHERLTALGWWGLPEALSQAWSSPATEDSAGSVGLRRV
ncbi:MAG TPA: hypothetical protein VFA63_07680 [Pseudonocardiaceae bacterium]|nr:hypothetical protein [Pseudonocardiaceae bacterium]